ncbi:hypothetical protein L202_01242 [Cryptococcus amylolentus CBS 6039]|uniref:WD repeat and SOF domain-containing protein 1 n=2 Tax=Cryptococcus amylolentus TaxID=104669 RepID=A0A1E3I582_9TREE|nr:hypothetical protein L202_01242 [Cryptococcus amylolentus CBS 6039]ODN83011.1 hypothetical protein L202_01242 [Cryptococcus amylolentus CBS 6039]ODO10634.1 hypothetical protein I350_01231 [Cryptococcus amylolentus CBS 6273]
MSLFGQVKRHTPSKPRRSPLPTTAWDADKRHPANNPWFTTIYIPLRIPFTASSDSLPNAVGSPRPYHPLSKQRILRLPIPIPPRIYARLPRLNSPIRLFLLLIALLGLSVFFMGFRKTRDGDRTWSPPFVDPDTMVITPEEAAMIWEWEVLSGHYPSREQPPDHLPIALALKNPVVPPALLPSPITPSPAVAYQNRADKTPQSSLVGIGPERHYLSVWDPRESQTGFTARPMPGSILDLDLVREKCDFGTNKYVRDCLEFLRVGGGMDASKRVRRGNYLAQYKQHYYEESTPAQSHPWSPRAPETRAGSRSRSALTLPQPYSVPASFDSRDACDPLHPRIFHMFWAGPFTDKPYMAVMSFLYTQNLGLDKPIDAVTGTSDVVRGTCRPQFWVWINPGPAAAVPNPSAKREMLEQLATNPWSAPFMHERFRDVVKFKMWNTTEQLDGIAELKPHWRQMPIFNSGGNTYNAPPPQNTPEANAKDEEDEDAMVGEVVADVEAEAEAEAPKKKKKDGLFEKVGSSSESDYDRLSVILSDMARFVLTHRFGGIYLDADTLFLRDWEELWNYRGQFAYRWSWHQKYNTAVLKLHKGSALSTFLFKTALENGLDFHPMTVTRYLKDAGLDKLLFMVPDALFDPAWLNMEKYQRDRPPFPYFPEFSQLFSNDKFETNAPQPVGFEGFFRGAFSYHFHNFWWLPFDPSRNFPDLGHRFIKGERALRSSARDADSDTPAHLVGDDVDPRGNGEGYGEGLGEEGQVMGREDMDDEVDLSWATVLKRTFESYVRGEGPNAYGEWLQWAD